MKKLKTFTSSDYTFCNYDLCPLKLGCKRYIGHYKSNKEIMKCDRLSFLMFDEYEQKAIRASNICEFFEDGDK